jgi:hypothetical protein
MFLGNGSVIVNGVQFSRSDNVAADNSVFIDDAPAVESDIRVGMIVKVRGSFGPTTLTGRYEQVDVEPQLIGAVANPTVSGFSVLNQSVTVTPFTIFEGVSRTPVAGTPVEVHGCFTGANAIDNTFSILGVAINLTGLQERDDPALGLTSEYENAANIRIDRGNFMALLRNNVSVAKAKAIADALNPPFAGGAFNPRSGVEIEEHR